jgi:hypothetical protein
MIVIEFYGVPRLRAGIGRMQIEASSLGQALLELGRLCPALEELVLQRGTLLETYKLSLNGDRFVTDPMTPLTSGDVLLLLSADVGG